MKYYFATILGTVFLTQVVTDEGDGVSPMGSALNTTTVSDSLDEVFEDWPLQYFSST